MSTTVDSRVVEMRFDNQHFEKNVQTSLSTLEKLKQKLNLTGASKGLEQIDKAARGTNIGHLGTAALEVGKKFSTMEIIGITSIANITNSAVNAGKRMIKALTIDPVTTGWSEYELKMGSIQTIMASTGESLETVNKYLNELNEYSDKTIYSFSDMTQNIGKFTNAGVKLEDAVLAIKGISNEAAVSGATANEASRAMYNFAQALSSGYVKLIDWKSIELANMATVDFKNQLIESALAAGTLTKAGDGLYKTLAGTTISATKNFNESLQDEWMTTEVLVKTLKDYADETTDIGKKATKAATEVKTFSQMMDALKESAQSGWAQTWEILFGDFEQGKSLWTSINKVLDGLIGKITKLRNSVLTKAFGGGATDSWEKLSKEIEKTGIKTDDFKQKLLKTAQNHGKITKDMLKDENAFNKCLEKGVFSKEIVIDALKSYANETKNTGKSTEDMTDKLKYFQKVVNDVWRGDYKNGAERIDALTKAGYKYAEVQDLVNKTVDGHKLKLEDLSDVQLKNVGYTEEQITTIHKLAEEAEKSGSSVNELIEGMTKRSGRELFFDSFANIFEELGKILDAFKKAWDNVFGDIDMGDVLYNAIEGFNQLTESIHVSEAASKNFQTIMTGLLDLFKLTGSVASRSIVASLKIFDAFLGLFDLNLLDVAASIAKYISAFEDWVEVHTMFGWDTGYEKIARVFKVVGEGVKKCVDAFLGLNAVKTAIQDFKNFVSGMFSGLFEGVESLNDFFDLFSIDSVTEAIENFFSTIEGWIKGLNNSEMFNAGVDMVRGLASGIASGVGIALEAIGNLATSIIGWFKSILGIHSPSTVFAAIGGFIIAGLILGLKGGFGEALSTMMTNGKNLATSFIDGIQNGFDSVGTFLKPIVTKCATVFGKIDFGSVLASVVGISMLSFFKTLSGGIDKVGDALGILAKPIEGIGKIMGAVADGITTLVFGFGKMQRAFSGNLHTKSIKNLAISLAILVGALIALTFFVDDSDKMWEALKILGALTVILLGLAAVSAIMSKASVTLGKAGLSLKGLNVGLIGMGITLLLLAATVKMIGNINPEQAKQGFKGLVGVIGAFVILMAALAGVSILAKDVNIAKVGGTLIGISIAMLLLIGVIKLIGKLSEDEIDKGARAIVGFVGMIALLGVVSRLSGGLRNIGGTMLQLSVALLLMIGCAKIIAGMEWKEMGKAAIGMLGFVDIITLLTLISNMSSKPINSIGGTLLQISGAMVLLAIIVRLLGDMEWGKMGKAAVGLMGLVGIIAMLVLITNMAGDNAPKIALTLLAMSVSIGILAAVAMVLGLIKLENLAKGIVAVGLLGGVIAGIVHASKGATDIKGTMIGIAVAIGVMAASLALLSFIKWEKLLSATASLGAVMLAFSVIVKSANGLGKGAMAPLIVLTIVVGLLAFVLHKLAELPIESSLSASASLSILLVAFGKTLAILGKTSALSPKLLLSVGILALVMGALAGILYLVQGMPVGSTIATAVALSTLLLAITAAVKILSTVKSVSPMALAAVGVMTLVMGALAGILYLIQDLPVASTMANAKALSTMLIALSGACVILGVVGLMREAAFIGIGALVTLIIGVGTLIAAIGALVDKFPKLEEFLTVGIPILEKIGYAIGSFFGNIVGGFADGATAGLPGIADNLSGFMDNISGFVEGARGVDESALDGMTNLVKMMAMLSGAKWLDGISDMFGGKSTEEFVSQLSIFADAMVAFSTKVDGKISEESVNAAANAGLMLAKLQNSIAGTGGIFQLFSGEKNLSNFSSQMLLFGDAIVGFSAKVKGNIDEAAVTAAANAGTLMATLQSKVQPTGGVVQWFTGDKDMSVFGLQLVAFGHAIVQFSNTVKGNIDESAVTAAANAGTLMAEMQSKIVPSGGVIGWFTGEKDMATFGYQLVAFGGAIVAFSNKVSEGVSEEAVTAAATAGSIMTELQSKIIPTGGVVSWFSGKNDLTTFGNQLVTFGYAMVQFSKTVAGNIDEEAVTAAATAGEVMITLQKSIPEDKWLDGKVSLDDFGKTISKFGGHIQSYSQKVAGINAEAIETSVKASESIIKITKSLASVDPDTIDNFKAKKLGTAIKDYSDQVANIDTTAVSNSINAINRLKNTIAGLAGLDTSGVSSFQSAVSSLAKTNVDGVSKSFSASASALTTVGGNLIGNINKGMKSKQSVLTSTGKSIVDSLQKQITSKAPTFQKAGVDVMTKFAAGITSSKTKVSSAIKSPIASGLASARSYYTNFYNAGSYLVSGFASGISANTWKAAAKARAMANAAEKAAKEALDINSPSRVFAALGSGVVEGFVKGISDNESDSAYASKHMARNAIDSFSEAISGINDILSGDMNMQPTIRPVLDLSDVRSGAGAISGLLGNGVTLGAMANVNAIGSMMNQNQNGNEVVSAINKLRKDLGNLGSTTYNVNGVTYDDGSNVSNAVKDIIRYTRIEGRV